MHTHTQVNSIIGPVDVWVDLLYRLCMMDIIFLTLLLAVLNLEGVWKITPLLVLRWKAVCLWRKAHIRAVHCSTYCLKPQSFFLMSKNIFLYIIQIHFCIWKLGFVLYILFILFFSVEWLPRRLFPYPFYCRDIFHINTSYFSLTRLCFVGLMSTVDFLSCFCYDKIKVGPLKWVTNFILPHRALRTWKPILIITLCIALYHRDIPRSYIQ